MSNVKFMMDLIFLFFAIELVVVALLLLSIFVLKSIALSIVFGICLLLQLVFRFKMMFPIKSKDIE